MPRKDIPIKVWVDIKQEYEEVGCSLRSLAIKHGLSPDTVCLRANLEMWEKGRLINGAKQTLTQKHQLAFIEADLLPDEVYGFIVDGMKNASEVIFEGKGDQMMATPQPDYKVRLKYIQEYHKLVGSYPDPAEINNILNQQINNFHLTPKDQENQDPRQVTQDYMEIMDD